MTDDKDDKPKRNDKPDVVDLVDTLRAIARMRPDDERVGESVRIARQTLKRQGLAPF